MTTNHENGNENKECKENSDAFDTPEQSQSRLLAIKILGSRRLSSHEMKKRLITKGESEESASETVKWLEGIGAVNDAEYASAIVRHYSVKGYGRARVKDELYRRGIPRDMWDDALAGNEENDAGKTDNAAHRYLAKKLRGSSDKNDLRRAMEALYRRGFSYEEAGTAMSEYLESVANTKENGEAE